MRKPSPVADLRGASRLAVELTVLVSHVVETMHHNIARRPGPLGRGTLAPTTGLKGFVYRSVQGVTRLVGNTIDTALAPLVPMLADAPDWPGRERVVCALNGVLGDQLAEHGNPLAIAMQLRRNGTQLALDRGGLAAQVPTPSPRVIVMVHGLCMSDMMWERDSHDHGRQLARDLDADVVCLRYNTGRHVSTSGAAFANLLESLVDAWPVPVASLTLIGHSMGGLVMRAACATGRAAGHAWLRRLRALVFLGTPHQGAPLERGGHGIDTLLGASPYTRAFTHLSRLRSAGITDMRYGSVLDEDWHGRDRFARGGYRRVVAPLPAGVPAFAIAGSLSKRIGAGARAPRGDGLVPVASALGIHADAARSLGIPAARQFVVPGTGHLDLLSSTAVYQRLHRWLTTGDESPVRSPAR